ncbi:rod shape-determining protein [candidate division WWE3 bacterium CG_4_10_14_0_2_um_filter_42_7]|uniref:Cell shape-determining protein MreB n=2 Tax=Katanobacteria TaxID=422282 RepID=A0A2H0X8P4_UNCKA|nr:MAG: rod shape-determining protein [candidate division WWE3 bacterium CG08_land_8_20_14_0_20_41_15]PIZ42783.1 MAG: rod shape-determining protein [candidate division WWE3 bacterium CG_4_10_14_0_2_um_filter_42_7]
MFSKKIGIDLGTANSVVYVVGKGVVLSEPTVVAVTTDDNKVVAVGNEAKEMLGRVPDSIRVYRPMREGVIADYTVTEAMLRFFINKACGKSRLVKPDVMISTPAEVSSVESRAVLDAALSAGARRAYLIPEPLAAAVGAGLPVDQPSGSMIVNLGGGTTEVAIISLGGIVVKGSARCAGRKIDEAIAMHIRRKYNLLIGDSTAEEVKMKIGSATLISPEKKIEVNGRDFIAGLPRTVEITSAEITEAIQPPLRQIIIAVKKVLEQTPPELSSDVIDKGVVLSGGTAMLKNLDKFITVSIGVPAHVVEEPMFCVVRGIGVVLENLEVFQKSVIKR